jgi:phosphoenolpyruvate carboxylase
MSARNPTEASGLHPTARPTEKRGDIEFKAKDTGLRQDVHTLGAIVGELLKEQCGLEIFDVVESARRAAIDRREGDSEAGKRLEALVRSLSPDSARNFVRAFSTYFQVVNTAEQVHRIRRRRDYLKDTSTRQPGSLEESVFRIKDSGLDLDGIQSLLKSLHIEPVFTADNLEPTRRTILRKQQSIIRRLVDIQNPALTPQEIKACFEGIRSDITTIWQTEESPHEIRTVFDELEHVLFYLTDVIYRAIPPLYEGLADALQLAYGEDAADITLPSIVSFASWIGGDIESRPDTTGRTIRETLARQRSLILDIYYHECRELSEKLSQSTSRISVSDEITERIRRYAAQFPNVAGSVPLRYREMPYRTFLTLITKRLQSTYDDDVYPYESAMEFLEDLQLIADSLKANNGQHAGLHSTRRLIRRLKTFGFHFLTLDIRQSALVNRKVVGHCLGEENWLNEPAEYRMRRIQKALERNESPAVEPDNDAKRTLAVFQAIAFCRRRYGQDAIGPYIISLAHGVDDVLSVLLLASWAELRRKDGSVPLDIAPYFETVEDLTDCADTMKLLLADKAYSAHLEQRSRLQTVMLSYSDSNKDGGLASARWSLHQAQSDLIKTLDDTGIDLTLFHGRGGTISRGAGRTHAAVLGSPTGAIRGRLRATEQGELVNAKFGVRGIALRTLEQAIGSVAVTSALPREEISKETGEWYELMEIIAKTSRHRYRSLIDDSPEFYQYFKLATPVDVIERMQIGMRPDISPESHGVDDLRSTPWDHAWTQSRHILPGWFGFGSGLTQAVDWFGLPAVQEMTESWYFFRALLYDVEMVLAKTDLNIAARYSVLAGDLHEQYFPLMRAEFALTVEQILSIKKQQVLLERQKTFRRSIRLRNPYVDPISLLQVDLLRRWREGGRQDEALFSTLVACINGITRGLQESG